MSTKQMQAADPNAKLSIVERLAYGLGDYSGNLVYSSISAFLLVYYTNVVGVAAGTAASIMAISKIFDGVSDLIMGRIVDSTHSRWGKARPWILRMCIPLAVCTVLMFSVPASLAGSAQVAYMFLTYNLVSTVCYTGLNVPYATLQGLMTTNQYERGLLGNFRMLLATAGTMTVNTVVYQLCDFFGGGDRYSQTGWTMTFVVLMIVFVVLNLATFFFCKERVVEEPKEEDGKKAQGPSLIECLKSLVVNRYWLLMVVFLFSLYFMMSTFFGGAAYYAQYVLGDADLYATIANPLSMAQIAMMFITPFIMKRIGKRNTGMIGMCVATVAFVATAFAGTNVTLVVLCNILKGAAFGCGAAVMFGMLQDSITYGSWLTGVQAMGMGNAASSFCMKVGSGLGTAALGWILSAGNFDNNPTGAAAVTAIKVGYIWVPVITCAIGIVCLAFFDLDKHYDQVLSDLSEGKWKGSK
ncbi:MAG: glycoside-pentoside-hexuronide (GPH):cation symporter [Clostridiales bacterium]|nr:glycoside-pentoside-hexuronide (GPH):cation symporter [Clostridiales bacterium]